MRNYLNDYKHVLYRQIRFFLYYHNKPNAKKINVYEWYWNLLDRYLCGLDLSEKNLNKYFYRIYLDTLVTKRYEDRYINAIDIVNLLNKK
jgi:hypothetical protein